jgi:hypothetical protein
VEPSPGPPALEHGENMCRRPEMPRRRAAHGVARLVVVLFVVVGLAVTYGTGRSRPVIPCTAHDVPAAAAEVAAEVAATIQPVMSGAAHDDPNRRGPIDGGVLLAALVILLTLGLTGPGARTRQPPVRSGQAAAPPSSSPHRAPSLAFLQVLRL